MTKKTWTVLELIDWSRQYLSEKGFENARLETELLLGHALALPRIELYLNYDRQMSGAELASYKVLLKRRLSGEPVQYVTGTAAFMLAEFEVNQSVLIPRPETEALTEVAIGLIESAGLARRPRGARGAGGPEREGSAGGEALVADVGTGSGVIAVSLAQAFPGVRVFATDSSSEALEVASRNADRAGVGERVEFLEGALLDPLRGEGLEGRLTALVSNPPYVRSGDIEALPAEVRDFEPREALDGGPDGLDCLRVMAQDGPALLAEAGSIALEVGDGQAQDVAAMLRQSLGSAEIRKDYAGRDRIVAGRRE
jgi:release factor glutamine methyltransferase